MHPSLKFFVAIVLSFTVLAAEAKKKAKPPSAREVASALESYRKAPAMKAKVKKTVTQEALGTEAKSEGDFYFSKGKLRMEMREPERSILVFDGKTVWFETALDEDRAHVTKMRANDLKKADSLLTALFDRKDIIKTFKLTSSKVEKGIRIFTYAPQNKKKSEVKMLEIALKDKAIERITYVDQVDNRVTLEFSDVSKGAVPATKFSYKVPKHAEVIEL